MDKNFKELEKGLLVAEEGCLKGVECSIRNKELFLAIDFVDTNVPRLLLDPKSVTQVLDQVMKEERLSQKVVNALIRVNDWIALVETYEDRKLIYTRLCNNVREKFKDLENRKEKVKFLLATELEAMFSSSLEVSMFLSSYSEFFEKLLKSGKLDEKSKEKLGGLLLTFLNFVADISQSRCG